MDSFIWTLIGFLLFMLSMMTIALTIKAIVDFASIIRARSNVNHYARKHKDFETFVHSMRTLNSRGIPKMVDHEEFFKAHMK